MEFAENLSKGSLSSNCKKKLTTNTPLKGPQKDHKKSEFGDGNSGLPNKTVYKLAGKTHKKKQKKKIGKSSGLNYTCRGKSFGERTKKGDRQREELGKLKKHNS